MQRSRSTRRCPTRLVKRGLTAGQWVRETASVVGGKGGGKHDNAQGGGTDVSKVKEAVTTARAAGFRMLT